MQLLFRAFQMHRVQREVSIVVGRIRYVREKGREEVTVDDIGPLTVMTVTLWEPEGLGERRLKKRLYKLEKTLCRQGIGRVVLPEGFPYTQRLELLRPVNVLPFYRGIADTLALVWLEQRGIAPRQGRVVLAASRLCPELCCTAERLCPQVRQLVIRVPEGGEDYARLLHDRYGLPVTPGFVCGNVALAFGPVEGNREPVLDLYGAGPEVSLSVKGLDLPEDCAVPLLALLWERGYLSRERLNITFSGQTLANGGSVCYNN